MNHLARVLHWLQQAGLDLLCGLRQWRTHPGFMAVAVLTLAPGVGVSAAMFGVTPRARGTAPRSNP